MKEKRRTINLQILALPMILIVYGLFIYVDNDLENDNQAKLEEYGSLYAVTVATLCLGLLTFFEDLLIFF